MILLVPLAMLLVAVAADATTHLPALANNTQGLKVTGFSSVVVHKSSGPGGLTVQEPPKGWPFSEVNINFPTKSSKEPPHSKPSETQVAAHTAPARSSLEALAKSRPPNGWHLSDTSQKITSSSNTKSVYKPPETYLASTTAPGFESHKKSSVAALKTRHESHQPEQDEAVEYVTLSLKNSKPKKRVPKSRYNNEPASFNVGYSIGFSTPPDALKPSREMLRLIASSQQQNDEGEVINGKPFESFTSQSHRKPRVHSAHTYKVQSNNAKPTENEEYPVSNANFYHSVASEGHRTDGRNKYTWKNVGSNIEVSSNMEVSDNVRQHVPKRSRRPNSVRPTVYYIEQGIQQFDHEHALGQSNSFHEGDAVVDIQQSGSTEKQNTVGNTALRMKDHALFVHQGESSQTKLPNSIQLGYSLNPLYSLQKPQQQESHGQEQVRNIPATVHIPKGNIPLTPYPIANAFGVNPQLAHPNAYLAGIHSGSQGTTIPALVIPMSSLAGLAGVLQGLQSGGQGGNAMVQSTAGYAVPSGLLQGSSLATGLSHSMYLGQPLPYATVASGFKHFQMPVVMKPQTESEETIPKHHQQQQQHSEQQQQTAHHHNSQHSQPQYQVLLSNTRQQSSISPEAYRTHSVVPHMHQHLNDQRGQMVKYSHIQIDPSILSKIPSYYHTNKDQALSQQVIHTGQGSSKLEFMPHGSNPSGIPLHELLKTQQGVQVFHQATNQDYQQHNSDVPSRNVKYVHSHEGASSGPHVHYITKVLQQPSGGHHMRLVPNVQYVTSKSPRQQSMEKEQAHRDIVAQQRALAAYNSMLSLTLFPQVKPTPSPVAVSSTQSSGSAYPLPSSFIMDLKPPPISVSRTSDGRN